MPFSVTHQDITGMHVPADSMVYSENTQHVVEGWKPEWER